jgi:hypothetical protein
MNLTKNNTLRTEILNRIKELDYTYSYLINDASERGMVIKPERLSKYVKGKSGGITEEQLLWLATRLGIYINLNFGRLINDNGKLTYKIPPYDELEALLTLSKVFPPKTA